MNSLTVRKYIAGTDYEPLSGVAFQITDGSGKALGTDDGIYYTVAKIRGESNAKKKLLEEVVKRAAGRRCWVIVGDGGAKKEAEKMKQMLTERLQGMEFLFEKQITATLAINTGPGLIGVMTLLDP